MPAQSPTLSPTLSAIDAAFLGSSSGMFFSTLPTRSAPTSAALGKIPPPTRINIPSTAAPKPPLCEEPATDTHEHREHRGAEAEALEDVRRVLLINQHHQGSTEEAETDREHAGDPAGAKGEPRRRPHPLLFGGSPDPHVGAHGERHADIAGGSREERAD